MKRVRTSEEVLGQIFSLFKEGKDRVLIAQELNVPYPTVCKVIARGEKKLAESDELTKLKLELKTMTDKYNKAVIKLIEHGILKVSI